MPSSLNSEQQKARDAVRRAVSYLRQCGIRVPRFVLTTSWSRSVGGAEVAFDGRISRMNMGRYPSDFLRDWLAMHELGHVLWNEHRPLRWKRFREAFGTPAPDNYDELYRSESWKTAATHRLSWLPGIHRPHGEPSWYGARAGGEERFCELLGLLYANEDFAEEPPADLADLWEVCWDHGLCRMI
ncbi:hypothetical protein OKA04_18285 [Luteolibacter flavescens]|uniref:IrrE N-terminal-like domain-containing protein n=1 Tax=Luteolibacter flavescens TaxID=1859460 RepID=A0ABT3FSY4_9BACT|nr:hypothetical protein [Luteolibacter flavescens]MCW1886693.1 hypothetical protein [Luteolibacter flavescens]